jgi:hypothetical protein
MLTAGQDEAENRQSDGFEHLDSNDRVEMR